MKTLAVYSQALRMKYALAEVIQININKLKDWFWERDHPEEIVSKKTKRAVETSVTDLVPPINLIRIQKVIVKVDTFSGDIKPLPLKMSFLTKSG